MVSFKRISCIFLTALLTATMLVEIAPLTSDASAVSGAYEDALAEEALDAAPVEEDALTDDLFEDAKKTSKKTPTKKPKNTKPKTVAYEVPEGAELTYRAYMHGKGWDKEYTQQGMVCGKPGKGLSIEALEVGIKSDIEGRICCDTYIDGLGWTGQAGNFEVAGNEKAKKPMQKIRLYLTDRLLVRYRVFYRVCLDTNGWLGWCCDGWITGNEDYDRCIEAIQIVLVERNQADTIKMPNINGVVSKTNSYYKDAAKIKAYMIKKAQKYSSKTKYMVLVDSQYCFLGVFKGKKHHWQLIKFFICSPGVYTTYWNGIYDLGIKTKGFYSYGSQVYWGTRIHRELWIHSITYKGHNGKKVLDGRLGKRCSHGCIRLATANAKWIYDNVPSWSKCVLYKKKFLK